MALYSIVDYLKAQGQDSSYNARKSMAEQSGITGYSGTAQQNAALLKQMQAGGQRTAQKSTAPSVSQNVTSGLNEGVSPGGSSQYGSRPNYNQSDRLTGMYNDLDSHENNRPDDFNSRYDGQIKNILNSIQNRKPFEYDMNGDQLYQQYKESYMRQGDLAMRDTMGNASALTGGYGSSFAQTVGSQAYDQQLGKLNDKIPELYQIAYGMYRDEGDDLYRQLGTVQGLDDTDYGRYRDTVSDYYSDRDYYYNKANNQYNQEYGSYLNDAGFWESDRSFDYQKQQDAQAQSNWQTQFDYQKQQDAAQMALQRARGGSSGGSRSRSSSESAAAKANKLKYAGYEPIAASIVAKRKENGWSDMEAYEYALDLLDSGQLSQENFGKTLKSAGIDERSILKKQEKYNNQAKEMELSNPYLKLRR